MTPAGSTCAPACTSTAAARTLVGDGARLLLATSTTSASTGRTPGGEPEPITPEPAEPAALRYADGRLTPDGRTVVCVRESHEGEGEAVNELVAFPRDGSAPAAR